MGKVVILSGVSGSGKSTMARALWNELTPGTYCKVVSADDYFMVDGKYQFDPTKLSDAHGACFRDFIATVCKGTPEYELVVVDNTNTTTAELSPYILGAQAYGWEVEILTAMCETDADIKACAARNSHGVSEAAIWSQHRRLCGRELMPWWKNTVIKVS